MSLFTLIGCAGQLDTFPRGKQKERLLASSLNYVQPEPDGKTYGFNMLKYMRERKNERSVTIFALGVMAAHWLPVKKEFVLAAIESNFAENVAVINKQYFLAGFDIARDFFVGLM